MSSLLARLKNWGFLIVEYLEQNISPRMKSIWNGTLKMTFMVRCHFLKETKKKDRKRKERAIKNELKEKKLIKPLIKIFNIMIKRKILLPLKVLYLAVRVGM